jgi:catechol 2,3-dioxygenase-like lactoylglutathione lyase family enzyme
MKSQVRLAAPVFAVADVKAAIDWYSNALGFAPKYINREEGDDTGISWNYALIENDTVEIHLARKLQEDETLSSPSNCYLFLNEIHSLHEHLTKMNANVTDLGKMPRGNTECWLHDPDGNRLVLSDPG